MLYLKQNNDSAETVIEINGQWATEYSWDGHFIHKDAFPQNQIHREHYHQVEYNDIIDVIREQIEYDHEV